jgi:AAA domain, putative AbiEii toxin, Type IV TA system
MGYRLNIADLPIAAENIFFDYDDSSPAQVNFRLSNGNHLKLYFPEQGACYLVPESAKRVPRTPSHFKTDFDIEIGFVPTLGPVEQKERLYEKEAARLALLTSGASRNFRNIWHHFPEEFERFRELVKLTWPGMDIEPPESAGDSRHLVMFCPEERHPRELCWSGYGFQVWCQMLTFIVKAATASILVIDEPDIYLHSDLQRQLVSLLRELRPDILIATHSTEIIAECEPNSLLSVHKKKASAQRVRDASQLKRVFSALGSNLNPTLTQLAKTRRVVFVEGLDFQILSTFARTLGEQRVANRADFAVVQTEGFNPKRAVDLASGIDATVGGRVLRAVVLDKDYRCKDEAGDVTNELQKQDFRVHIHQRKELENYLLDADVIGRAVDARLKEKARRSGVPKLAVPPVAALVEEAIGEVRHATFAQIQAREVEYRRRKAPHLDQATITAGVSKRFDAEWSTLAGRLSCVPGKEVLGMINARLQELVGVSVSDAQIAQHFKVNEIHSDIRALVEGLAIFCRAASPD